MPPIPSSDAPLPRLVIYYQTHHDPTGQIPITILPLVSDKDICLTHLILAALHINEDPLAITLNNDHPSHPKFQTLWAEMRILQASGIKVLGMLGGAAQGSYQRLDGSQEQFETYYTPIRDMVRERGLDGLDLDVEEEMSLEGIIRLIDRIRRDFGKDFIITLAPVAAALLWSQKNLSGFDYEALEVMRGSDIAWYNTQFYSGWGDLTNPAMYDMIIQKGFSPEKVLVGMLTNPQNGNGYVPWFAISGLLTILKGRYQNRFGGVMGWEYFNSLPGGAEKPYQWARDMTRLLRGHLFDQSATTTAAEPVPQEEADTDEPSAREVEVPNEFEYYSDAANED